MNRAKSLVASIAVMALLAQGTAGIVDAASTTPKKTTQTKQKASVKTLNNLSAVKVTSKSSVRLSNVNILAQEEGSVLTYTLTYTNNDSKTLSLVDYWTKVKTNSGTVYSVTAISADKDKKKVVPGSSLSVTYTAKIAKGLKYSDLNFQIIKWNFSVAGYEQLLGSIKIPSTYSVTTPVKSSAKLNLNGASAAAKVNSVNILGLNDSKYVYVELNLQNTSSKTLENPNLKFVVQTAGGTPFALSADSSSSNYQILPQETKTLNLIAKVPKTVNLKNLQLLMAQTDETTKNDLPIASMDLGITTGQYTKTAVNKEKALTVDNNKITTKINSVSRNQSFGESTLSIQFELANKGDSTITLPNYSFEVQVGSKTYPLTASGLTGATLGPDESQIISIDGIIPVIANEEEMELILKTPTGISSGEDPSGPKTTTGSYPIALYSFPEFEERQSTAGGQERTVKNNDGVYGVTLDSVQKLPWDSGNILTSKITITNKGNKAAKLPEFVGAYKMDGANISSTVQLINSNTTRILGEGEKADVYVVANIPSDLNFSQMQVQLQQKTGTDSTSNWVMFTKYGKTNDLKLVADGSLSDLNTAGKKADLQTRKTYLYKGTAYDVFYTELVMRNQEDKQSNLSRLTGYFRTKDGQYYKATANQVKRTVGPKAASLVTFSAQIPKDANVADWDLVIGESISENKFTSTAEEAVTGYVNASAMELTLDSRDLKNSLKDIELFPYTLNIANLEGRTTGSGLEVKFKYELKRDLTYEMGEFKHKFLLEVVESSGAKFEKEIELEKDFELAYNKEYSYVVNDPIFTTIRTGSFQFSIYDLYDGVKTKIATQAIGYGDSDL